MQLNRSLSFIKPWQWLILFGLGDVFVSAKEINRELKGQVQGTEISGFDFLKKMVRVSISVQTKAIPPL